MKKIIAMLLMGAVLFTGAIGCSGDSSTAKDKDKAGTPKPADKDKPKP